MNVAYENEWLLVPIPPEVPTPPCSWCWPTWIAASHYDFRGYPCCAVCGRRAVTEKPSMPTFAMVKQ